MFDLLRKIIERHGVLHSDGYRCLNLVDVDLADQFLHETARHLFGGLQPRSRGKGSRASSAVSARAGILWKDHGHADGCGVVHGIERRASRAQDRSRISYRFVDEQPALPLVREQAAGNGLHDAVRRFIDDIKDEVVAGDYERVCRERDDLQAELNDCRRALDKIKSAIGTIGHAGGE